MTKEGTKPFYTKTEVDALIAAHAALFGLHNKVILKTADQDAINTTTLANDTELLFAAAANEIWLAQLYILSYSASSTPDLKIQWSLPSGALGYHYVVCYNAAASPTQYRADATIARNLEGNAAINPRGVLWLLVIMGTTPGNIQLQWAQNTADAGATTMKAGSHIIAHRLS